MKFWRCVFCFSIVVVTARAHAVGENIIDAVMRSDFVFDRNVSNVPFFPVGYLGGNVQGGIELEDCGPESCELSLQNYSHALGLPVWVGQKNMILLGETLDYETIELNVPGGENQKRTIKTAGGMLAWVGQPSTSIQVGAFYYYYSGFDFGKSIDHPWGSIGGGGFRYRHRPTFHTYWGLVGINEQSMQTYIPYIGFDLYLGKKWSVSALLPWPAISYAPNKHSIYRLGAIYSTSQWVADGETELDVKSISQVNVGLSYERQLFSMLWGEVGAGYSGFGRYSIEEQGNVEFEQNIASTPFIKMSLNIRP
ncbi:hypothetical protein [Teredinibacter franksiae]|uniref:hypothetical protein n=1 Tax=Teredinibacter franksiae TaxID=2761453 RepID=UPI0016259A71|nr:hypothetical protein [Teredinibacter franksiae]